MRSFTKILSIVLILTACSKEAKIPDSDKHSFYKLYGGVSNDEAVDVVQGENDEYYVIGTYSSPEKQKEIVYLRLDAYGNLLAQPKTYGYELDDEGVRVKLNDEGGLFILGNTSEFVPEGVQTDVLLIKADLNGDTIWTKKYGNTNSNEVAGDMIIDSDGNLVITGYSDAVDDIANVLFLKIENNGAQTDLRTITTAGFTARGIKINDLQNKYLFSGHGTLYGENSVYFQHVTKQGNSGISGFDKKSGSTVTISDMLLMEDHFLILGTIENITGPKEIYLKSFTVDSLSLNEQPSFTFSDDQNLGPSSMVIVDDEIVITGTVTSKDQGQTDYFIKRIGLDGNEKLHITGGDPANDEHIKKIIATSDGGFLLVGSSTFNENANMCLFKTDFDGLIDFSQ